MKEERRTFYPQEEERRTLYPQEEERMIEFTVMGQTDRTIYTNQFLFSEEQNI